MFRSVLVEYGDGFVTIPGVRLMLKWFADNWGSPQMVSYHSLHY